MMKKAVKLLITTLGLMLAAPAMAFNPGAPGDLGYEIYDMFAVQLLGGPVGWVIAAAGLGYGLIKLREDWKHAGMVALGAGALANLDAITTSVGVII
jgi:hypothetical protein